MSKQPKLKYYYHAMNMRDFLDFDRTRRIDVSAAVTLTVTTGEMSGRDHILLCDTADHADSVYRAQWQKASGVVRVLRIPREYILAQHRRSVPTDSGWRLWTYHAPLLIPHCGVIQFDIAPDA